MFRLPTEAFIRDHAHTQAVLYRYRGMTDGDGSSEVEVRCEQENIKDWSIQCTNRVAK